MLERCADGTTMGVDTGKELHVVISRRIGRWGEARQVVYLGVHHSYQELDALMRQFEVNACVIDGLPEIHAAREFAVRHRPHVYLCFFNEHQRGSPAWNYDDHIVQVNRTEALDLSRAAIRERRVVLPRRTPPVEEFATHVTNDAKKLEEDEETGAKSFRYVRTGPDHFSLAFTYDCLAALRECRPTVFLV